MGPTRPLNPCPKHFLPSFNYPFIRTMASNYSLNSNKPPPHTSLNTFTSGIDNVVSAKLTLPPNNVSIGSSNHLFPSLPKMWLSPSPSMKKNPLARPNSSNSFMPIPDTYTRYSQTPLDPCHLAKTNLGCLTQQTD